MHRVCSVYPVKYNETSIITELYQCLKKVFKGNVTPTMHPISQHGSDQKKSTIFFVKIKHECVKLIAALKLLKL